MAEPYARTVAESYASTVAESYARTVAEPYARTVAEPDARTVAEPYARTVAEPDASTVAEPDARSWSHTPGSDRITMWRTSEAASVASNSARVVTTTSRRSFIAPPRWIPCRTPGAPR